MDREFTTEETVMVGCCCLSGVVTTVNVQRHYVIRNKEFDTVVDMSLSAGLN